MEDFVLKQFTLTVLLANEFILIAKLVVFTERLRDLIPNLDPTAPRLD